MEGKFSKYLKGKKDLIKQVIELLKKEYSYASCLATDVIGKTILVDAKSTTVVPSMITEAGFVFRVYNGEIYSEMSTSSLTKDNVDYVIEEIRRLTHEKMSLPHVTTGLIKEEKLVKSFKRNNQGRSYEINEIIDILKSDVVKIHSFSDKIVSGRLMFETNEISKMFISGDRELEQYYTWTNSVMIVVARDGNVTKYARDFYGDNSEERCLNFILEKYTPCCELAIELLDATNPRPGYYDVITAPSISGLIAHEAFGHGVEMDMFVKDRAKAKEYVGKPVASKLLSMHDGAKSTLSAASYFFDDEGTLAQDTKIINKGVLVHGICDAISGLQLGSSPTGNGRRQSYKRKAYTRMTNTFFEGGKSNLEEMISSISDGMILYQTNNGMEDPKNWGIQCTCEYGREIKDGKLTGRIFSPIVLSGYVIDLLNSISEINPQINVTGAGMCGKGYKEWVRVSDGGAYMKARVKIG